jgi:hypothetical protein
MSRSLAVAVICAVLGATGGAAHAGPCGDAIAQLRDAARESANNPATGPTAPQSLGAQLRHQPTPESVQRARQEAQSRFAALLDRAAALDAEGKDAECMQAVADARRMLELN